MYTSLSEPRRGTLREALRILPDVLRLLRRLAADKSLPVVSGSDSPRSCAQSSGGQDSTQSACSGPGTAEGFTALTRLTGLHRNTRARHHNRHLNPQLRRRSLVSTLFQ